MSHDEADPFATTVHRKIIVNGPQLQSYVTNSISTTKYNIFTFLPKFLFEQFHNLTNCFFLLVAIIQQFPEASSLGRYTTLIPLCIILSLSGVKEILEDFQRHRADRRVNKKVTQVLRYLNWEPTEWRHVQVGDLVRVYNDESFPADLLLLQCSCEAGVGYIETVNLDGENNLKIRHHVPGVNQETHPSELSGIVECDLPNELIYKFNGIYHFEEEKVSLKQNHLLLRGAMLRNTSWIIGLVIYTGKETKIMRNSSQTSMKRSSVSVIVNKQVLILFAMFIAFTLLHGILFMWWNNENYQSHWYLPLKKQDIKETSTLITFLVFGIIYSIMIPISLQVMQELSRYIQGSFISNDADMYYAEMDVQALVKTSSLNEDLGLVKYVLTDKTGTLTKNVLEFKCCSIEGLIYDETNFDSLEHTGKGDSNMFHHLFVAICVCPGVVPVQQDGEISYFASSPDHKALLQAARNFNYELTERDHTRAVVKVGSKYQTYHILCDFDFNNDRRRTSVIVENPQHEIVLYCMGADDVIFQRLTGNMRYLDVTSEHLDEFSSRGLRTLCIAMAKVDRGRFQDWYPLYKEAQESLVQANLIDKAENAIVQGLTLVGATAVEDKLQDDVPETIFNLLEAGIHIWMLTGDKQETAINIGFACRLLNADMPLIALNVENLDKLRYMIDQQIRILGDNYGKPDNDYSLVITGACLQMLLDSPLDAKDLIKLMLSCRSVICCRTTPKQKALVAKHVDKHTNHVTLAIGDGANDVAMIQTASIGVGISGNEGLQAANAADYSIGQFKYLKKLLLVHGTWSYNRICKMIYFIYYKNVVIATMQFYLTSVMAWSGMLFFDRWARMLYNVLLTGAPTLAMGIFEQNAAADLLMEQPHIYTRNVWFNMKSFICCIINGVFHGMFLTWMSFGIFQTGVYWSSGRTDVYLIEGNMVYTVLIIIVCLKSGLHTLHWTNLTFLCIIGSVFCWIVLLAILSYTWPYLGMGEDMPGAIWTILKTPYFWTYCVICIFAILMIDTIVIILYRTFKERIINWLRARHLIPFIE
ncbi:phospholipid-transporting ATPase IA-like [Planococcus citri]|uniref:phospholipid-transporting ATPase IA-like n=1 Tax=Planococcus citri TaxID=170843 RepID=UPI0031F79E11